MTPERLADLAAWGVSFDTETHLSQPGLLAPPLVCGSIATFVNPDARVVLGQGHPGISGELLDKEGAISALLVILRDKRRILIGAHIAYDLLVVATECARRGIDIFPEIFAAYEEGRVYDILIGEALNANADGNLGVDPRTGGDLRDPITNEPRKYYSLEIVTDLLLGRTDAKANDEWRLKYALLEHIPIAAWPPAARTYPIDDVRNTHEDALAQAGVLPKRTKHNWHEEGDSTVCTRCKTVLTLGETPDCWTVSRHRNLHQMATQSYTAWCMHLGAAWGFNVDQSSVDAVEREVLAIREKASLPLIAAGLLKWKRDKGVTKLGHSKSRIARAVAVAYGATGTCPTCSGTGKVVSPNKKMPVKRAWDPEKDGINCKDCCATGLDLATAPTLTLTDPSETYPKGQIAAGADILNESGDDTLRALADYEEDAKTVENYIPYLRKAQVTFVGADGVTIRYPKPLTLRPNVFLATDRVSYGDSIQQFPRDGGLRACIRARNGFVLVSADYNQGELVSHSQSCLWILGYSDLAKVMNAGDDPHSDLAATVLGMTYEDFYPLRKKGKYKDARQASKPWNFGKPGGMGVPKLVQTQRRQGPDTPCENGPVMIEADEIDPVTGKKKLVPGYRGLRFCILMDGATSCGSEKLTTWGKEGYERQITPTCKHCLECASRLETEYYNRWSEARPYFRYTSNVVDHGQTLSPEQCALHGLPIGTKLAPGEMMQHVSGIIRGGVRFNDCSNGYMQSLLAVAAKKAMRVAQRECCDRTVRVPTDACKGGKVSAYAGKASPLLGSRCIVLQHDEIIAEIPEANGHDGAMRLSEIMERALMEVCPDMVRAVKAPPAMMLRWLKAAEPLFHSGRLVPWTPEHDGKTCLDPDCVSARNKKN